MAFKKCKYCGSSSIVFETGFSPIFGEAYLVVCKNCRNSTGKYQTKDLAFMAWNNDNSRKTT